jgi:hypothetical protein
MDRLGVVRGETEAEINPTVKDYQNILVIKSLLQVVKT